MYLIVLECVQLVSIVLEARCHRPIPVVAYDSLLDFLGCPLARFPKLFRLILVSFIVYLLLDFFLVIFFSHPFYWFFCFVLLFLHNVVLLSYHLVVLIREVLLVPVELPPEHERHVSELVQLLLGLRAHAFWLRFLCHIWSVYLHSKTIFHNFS